MATPIVRPGLVRVRRWLDAGVAFVFLESRFGIETRRTVRLADLGLADEERISYIPSEWLTLRKVFRSLEVKPDDVLVDFGAGKGRVLIMGARYPFRRIVGVEVSSELAAIAERNVRSAGPRLRCKRIEVIVADACEYEVPDDVTVVFLYAPFTGSTFSAVIGRILASVDRHPRRVRVVYNLPTEEASLMMTGRVRQLEVWRSRAVGVYEITPASVL